MFSKSPGAIVRPFVAALALAAIWSPVAVRAEARGATSCPVLGNKIEQVTKETQSSDYRGVRYYFCCAGCKPQFDKDQAKFLKGDKAKDKTVGISLFEPVTTKRIEPEKAAVHSDYQGVRYFFAQEEDKTAFDKDAKKYVTPPKKELLFCPVSNEIVESYQKASDYSDYKGTRYYFCCAGCKPAFDKDQTKYLDGLDARIKAAQEKAAAAPDKDSNP